MRVLLDTCVICELQKPKPSARVCERVAGIAIHDLFLSVITLGELTKGVLLLEEGSKRKHLEKWLLRLESDFSDRILPIDANVARMWGTLEADARKRGRPIPTADGLIAATALRHGLHVMTRNVSDFKETRALVINPWE